MLSKIEVAYLGILRVVLLIAATAALLVTIVATAAALPAIGRAVGITGHQDPRGASLREFIDSKNLTEVQANDSTESGSSASSQAEPLPRDLATASRNVARYAAKNGDPQITQAQWDEAFRGELDSIPDNIRSTYAADVLRLSEQLERSKGRPLSNQHLAELIDFHHAKFLASAQEERTAEAASAAASMFSIMLAGGAFVIFILILFNFIFVKIERNLRPAHAGREIDA
jgi:hypothetical protein